MYNHGVKYSVHERHEDFDRTGKYRRQPQSGCTIHRPSFFRPLSFSMSCVPCLLSSSLFPSPNLHTSPTFSLNSSRDKALALLHEATRARPAIHATHLLEQAEGSISCPREDTRAQPAPTTVISRELSEGHTSLPY
jgi:hypothetical protein